MEHWALPGERAGARLAVALSSHLQRSSLREPTHARPHARRSPPSTAL
jgi:hypothetical protein